MTSGQSSFDFSSVTEHNKPSSYSIFKKPKAIEPNPQTKLLNKKRFSGISSSNYIENKIMMQNSEKRKNNKSSNENVMEFRSNLTDNKSKEESCSEIMEKSES